MSLGIIYCVLLSVGSLLLLQHLDEVDDWRKSRQTSQGRQSLNVRSVKAVLARKEFCILWTTRFGMVLISQAVSGMYKAFGMQELRLGDEFLAEVGAVAGLFNCVGRILFGILVDKFPYKYVRDFFFVPM